MVFVVLSLPSCPPPAARSSCPQGLRAAPDPPEGFGGHHPEPQSIAPRQKPHTDRLKKNNTGLLSPPPGPTAPFLVRTALRRGLGLCPSPHPTPRNSEDQEEGTQQGTAPCKPLGLGPNSPRGAPGAPPTLSPAPTPQNPSPKGQPRCPCRPAAAPRCRGRGHPRGAGLLQPGQGAASCHPDPLGGAPDFTPWTPWRPPRLAGSRRAT